MADARPIVTLYDGREVSSWSREWLDETGERFRETLYVLSLPDQDTRRAHLARYEARIARAAAQDFHADPDAVGAEARRRLEAAVMQRWRVRQAAAAAAEAP